MKIIKVWTEWSHLHAKISEYLLLHFSVIYKAKIGIFDSISVCLYVRVSLTHSLWNCWSKIKKNPLSKKLDVGCFRSSRLELFGKKVVLKSFARFSGKPLWRSLIFNEVVNLRLRTAAHVFFGNFVNFLRTIYFEEHFRTAASVVFIN